MDQPAPRAPASAPSILDRVFDLGNSGSNVRTELLAGLTTFLTMVYIVFVNPQILGNAGMDKGAVFVATCIAAAFVISGAPRQRRAPERPRACTRKSCGLTAMSALP